MRDQELDLIAAFAAGDLDPDAASRAEELIARGGAYQEEYEAQIAANAVLADTGPARLSDFERARLHRSVMTEVGAASPVSPASPRSLRWLRPLAVAAAAVVFVGFGALYVSNLGGAGDAATETVFDEGVDEAAPVNTTVHAFSRDSVQAGAEEDASVSSPDGAGRTSTDQALVPAISAPFPLGSIDSRDIDEQFLTDIYLGVAQFTVDAPAEIEGVQLSCTPAAAELSEEDVLAFGTADYDGQPAQFFGFVSRRLIFLDAIDCSLLGEHP